MANARALQSLAHTPLQTSIVDQKQMLARTELPRRLLSAFGFLKKLAGQSSAVMLLSSGRHSVRATSPLFGLVQTGGNLLQDRAGLRSRRARVLCQSADSNTSQVADGSSRSKSDASPHGSDLIFIGTGTSEGIPRVSCLTHPKRRCKVCFDALKPGSRNRRRNTSLMIRFEHPDGRRRNILIDAGKFFYHSALEWFPHFGIRNLDALLITHSHADATGGLDDLRDWTNNIQDKVPIYVAPRDLEVMGKTHYYIVDPSGITKGTAVSKLDFKVMPDEPFQVEGLEIVPLPVWHGKGYKSLGFRFGKICYISDVSEIPAETYPLLEDCDLLILDALRPDSSSSTHFGLEEALNEVRKIKPKRTLFTGMMHIMDHDEINSQLAALQKSEGIDAELGYDGMRIPISL